MPKTSRRTFAKTVAALPLAATDLFGEPKADEKPLATALTSVVRAQSGQHLTREEMNRVAADFSDYAPYIEKLRAFRLTNADEPDFTFASLTKRW